MATLVNKKFFKLVYNNWQRTFSSVPKKINEKNQESSPIAKSDQGQKEVIKNFNKVFIENFLPKLNLPFFWNETIALKKVVRQNSFIHRINSTETLLKELQKFNGYPKNFEEFKYILKQRKLRKELLRQQFIHQRVVVLKPDLAAAHFLVEKGGMVKFKNHNFWVGKKEANKYLPCKYTPGYHVEKINAEGTNLRREGLKNIARLPHLKWLSLKGLKHIDDWCLDWIANEFENLEYLDISGCSNVTYKALSCFYKFESLKALIVQDISDTPEFKVACLMLQDIMPELRIGGIELKIPEKIDFVENESTKSIANS